MSRSLLDEISAALGVLPPRAREAVEADARTATASFKWVPNPGPQTEGFFCAADETFYGGQAGGGKTDLGIGLALTTHRRTLILRRINKDALKIVPRIEEILGTRAGYNGQLQRWKRLKDNGIAHSGHNGAGGTNARTRDGQLKFANKRAEAWWRFREELDPDQEGGSAIALPPDAELRADLAAPSYEVGPRGLLIESKHDIRKRLGRSPGKGDAVVMCLSQGNAAVKKQLQSNALMPSTATRGFEHMKRKR